MRIIIDGDGCPSKKIIYDIGKKYNLIVIMVINICHLSLDIPSNVELIKVDNQSQAVDMKIASIAQKDDIVITGDYGLASLVLGKDSKVITFSGCILDNSNIDQYLMERYLNQKWRDAKGRVKGPKPRTKDDDKRLYANLIKLLS